MLLSVVVHTHSLRYLAPAAVMLGSAPAYVLCWAAGRALLLLAPGRLRRRLDDRLYDLYQSLVLLFFENYTGLEVVLYGDLPSEKENVIYLSNHQSTVDWVVADMLAVRQNALGHVRYVLKDGLKWLPLYGWYFSQHGGVYVKRRDHYNEKAIERKLKAQMEAQIPMYLVIFPEGTRYNPEAANVIEASKAFANKEGLPELSHVLTPRIRATHAALNAMSDHLHAIYDITVAYEGTLDAAGRRKTAPSMPEFLCCESPRVHIHFERIDIQEVPHEPHFFKLWLHERFEKKDKLMADFYERAATKGGEWGFPGSPKASRLRLRRTLPSAVFLATLTLPMLLTETGRSVYWRTWLYGTLLGWAWVAALP
ncbi:1-acyl-sn-glycerol-3-phosphate acyltransferase epsilon isoform X1 [Lethenteron reissneri]|uniref:1-acyl-sn-glycerol-3-phosphate acyltransferase epsilon isoform X1 n=1 Tax=Lethenteron reissneri TaxID=7753 RepID=UPI002AB6A02D|nr:1-acyl-sn-glycerol-3-phosphate acyltransferase epsilon isoform X1 [Lethenteron reissneri]